MAPSNRRVRVSTPARFNNPRIRSNASTRRALEAAAKQQFRARVRRQAGDIDLAAVEQHRAYCAQFGIELLDPKLQYIPNNWDRGRYYVVSKEPLPGHTKKYFRYVSPPLSRTVLQTLEDWRVARELQDEGLRPLNLGIDFRPLGNAAFLRTLGLDPHGRPLHEPGAGPVARRRPSALTSKRTRGPPRDPSPPSMPARAVSPDEDIVVLDGPPVVRPAQPSPSDLVDLTLPGHSIRVFYYYENDEAPTTFELQAPFPNASVRMREYQHLWNAIEVKLSSVVQILTHSDPWTRTWCTAPLGRFTFPPSTRGIVLARNGVVVHHGSFRKNHIWAYKGPVPPMPVDDDKEVIIID